MDVNLNHIKLKVELTTLELLELTLKPWYLLKKEISKGKENQIKQNIKLI